MDTSQVIYRSTRSPEKAESFIIRARQAQRDSEHVQRPSELLVRRGVLAHAREGSASCDQKFQKGAGFRACVAAARDVLSRALAQISAARECLEKCLLDLGQNLARESAAPEADYIQSIHGVALGCHAEGRDVARDAPTAADHHALSDAHELVDDRAAAEKGPVADVHVSAQQYGVRDHHALSDPAVVRDVTSSHEEAVRAHPGRLSGLGRAVDGDVLADHGASPDMYPRRGLRLEAEVLRIAAEHRIRVHDHAVLEMAVAPDEGMRMNHAPLSETGTVLDECCRMYARAGHVSACAVVTRILSMSSSECSG